MNKKGFTLAEVLGVLVVVGLLMILVAPLISDRIRNMHDKADEAGYAVIYSAAEQYILNNSADYPRGDSYCIDIRTLVDNGLLTSPVVSVSSGENIENKSVNVTISIKGSFDFRMNDGSC